jgi:hypothetical protein
MAKKSKPVACKNARPLSSINMAMVLVHPATTVAGAVTLTERQYVTGQPVNGLITWQ